MQAFDFYTALSGCDHPLETLLAGHERIEAKIGALRALAAHVREHGCDEHARWAAFRGVGLL